MNLYISNLDSRTSEKDLNELFSEFGAGHSSKVRSIMDTRTRIFNTFSYLEITDEAMATKAIEKYNDAVFLGRKISVAKAG